MVRILTHRHDDSTQRHVAQAAADQLQIAGLQVKSIRNASEDRAIFSERFNIVTVILLIMAFLLATVGSLGLMGTMSINVLERTREIGVMRAIGASNSDIHSIVIIEGLVIGLISWTIAILVAVPITSVLTRGVGLAILTAPMPAVYGLSGIIAWLIFTLILATIASALPARRASQLTVRDTLAYE